MKIGTALIRAFAFALLVAIGWLLYATTRQSPHAPSSYCDPNPSECG